GAKASSPHLPFPSAPRSSSTYRVQKSAGTARHVAGHDLRAMLEYLLLLVSLIRATMRDREALIAENLLLRHQLGVLTRPTRKRPRLRTRDKLFWVVARARSAVTGADIWSWSDLRPSSAGTTRP